MTRLAVATGVVVTTAAGAAAQGAGERGYVGGAVYADISRYSSVGDVRIAGLDEFDGPNGTVAGGAVRAGVALGAQWGVELEMAFSGTHEWSPFPFGYLAAASAGAGAALPPELTMPVFQGTAERQVQTGSVLGWVRRPMTSRVSLVVLAGLGLNRTSQTSTYFSPLALVVPPQTTIYYDAGPVVGVDLPVRLTDHLDLTGGFRVHVVGDAFTSHGWLLRPSAGVRWRF